MPILYMVTLLSAIACVEDEAISPIFDIQIINVRLNSIDVQINVVSPGNRKVIESGILWSLQPGVLLDNSRLIASQSNSPTSFNKKLINLPTATTYFFKGYFVMDHNEVLFTDEVSATTVQYEIEGCEPSVVNSETEISIQGSNFIAESDDDIKVFINDQRVPAPKVTPSSITFDAPAQSSTDSISISVEIVKEYRAIKKLFYQQGKWTPVGSLTVKQTQFSRTNLGAELNGKYYLSALKDGYIPALVSIDQNFGLSIVTESTELPSTTGDIRWLVAGGHLYGIASNFFFKFNDETKLFSEKVSLPFTFRAYSIVFSVDEIGYVFDNEELWQFDPTNSPAWTKCALLPFSPSLAVAGLNKVYFLESKGSWWSYDVKSNLLERRSDHPLPDFNSPIAFYHNNKYYVGSTADFYEYDADRNAWKNVARFPTNRILSFSFSLKGVGYLGGGTMMVCNNGCIYSQPNDLWKFQLSP
jgi:hypothetical protein